MMHPHQCVQLLGDTAKSMKVPIPYLSPILELDTNFEGTLRVAQKGSLINPAELVELADRRDRRFAYTHDANCIAFKQFWQDGESKSVA